ncbi:hypothetical protein AB6A40_000940 [Gnathostoma spinigerum]|uniref:Uncharacterized protein n=1 Tax=Gnathostoma spinigerum TaxID=75299 RepID=A0ABD6E9Z4_9BILA
MFFSTFGFAKLCLHLSLPLKNIFTRSTLNFNCINAYYFNRFTIDEDKYDSDIKCEIALNWLRKSFADCEVRSKSDRLKSKIFSHHIPFHYELLEVCRATLTFDTRPFH